MWKTGHPTLEPILTPKSCFPGRLHQFQSIWHFFLEFYSKNPQKMAKMQNLSKIVKNGLKFWLLWFLRYFNMQYLKKKHFSCRIQIQTKKSDFFEEKIKKNWIFPIFCYNRCWLLVFNCPFLKFVPKNLKTMLTPAFERFWNQKSPKESLLSLFS